MQRVADQPPAHRAKRTRRAPSSSRPGSSPKTPGQPRSNSRLSCLSLPVWCNQVLLPLFTELRDAKAKQLRLISAMANINATLNAQKPLRSCTISNKSAFSPSVPAEISTEFQNKVRQSEMDMSTVVRTAKAAELEAINARLQQLTSADTIHTTLSDHLTAVGWPPLTEVQRDTIFHTVSLHQLDIITEVKLRVDKELKLKEEKRVQLDTANQMRDQMSVAEQVQLAVRELVPKMIDKLSIRGKPHTNHRSQSRPPPTQPKNGRGRGGRSLTKSRGRGRGTNRGRGRGRGTPQ